MAAANIRYARRSASGGGGSSLHSPISDDANRTARSKTGLYAHTPQHDTLALKVKYDIDRAVSRTTSPLLKHDGQKPRANFWSQAIRDATDYMRVAATWDRGSRKVRELLLQDFVTACQNKTSPQLEADFANGASLFLTRITAWLRLTYLLKYNLSLQMQAIAIFLTSSGGQRFLLEFVEVGGVLTLLEILELGQVRETDKAEALKLLIHVACAGRKYKEFVCENYGVRAVADCLAKSKLSTTQDHARHLLQELGTGNPKYLMQVYKSLVSLVTATSNSISSQQFSGQALRFLLPSISNVHISVVDATISLLKSPHVEIQYEGYEILKELLRRPNLHETIVNNLIAILQTHVEDVDEAEQAELRSKRIGLLKTAVETGPNGGAATTAVSQMNALDKQRLKEGYQSLFVQQAYASRLLSIVAATTPLMAQYMINEDVVLALLTVIANMANQDAQRAAAQLLHFLADSNEEVVRTLKGQFGAAFFEFFCARPDTFYRELTKDQVRYLRRSTQRARRNKNARQEEELLLTDNELFGRTEDLGGSDGQRNASSNDPSLAKKFENLRAETVNTPGSAMTPAEETGVPKPAMPSTLMAMRDFDEGAAADKKKAAAAAAADVTANALAEGVYTPFQHVHINSSLSVSKFGTPNTELTLEKFNSDLDKFRAANKERPARIGANERAIEASLQMDDSSYDSRLSKAEFPDFEQELTMRFPQTKSTDEKGLNALAALQMDEDDGSAEGLQDIQE
ncbi:hypothetical protein RI367_001858 [Sorochytrium milnesiophthora]